MFYDGFLSRMIESYHNMTYGQVVGNAIHVRRLRSNLWPSPYSISISTHISTVDISFRSISNISVFCLGYETYGQARREASQATLDGTHSQTTIFTRLTMLINC